MNEQKKENFNTFGPDYVTDFTIEDLELIESFLFLLKENLRTDNEAMRSIDNFWKDAIKSE